MRAITASIAILVAAAGCSKSGDDDNAALLLLALAANSPLATCEAGSLTPSGGPSTGRVMITEFGFTSSDDWIEIHNGTNQDLNLSSFSIKTAWTYDVGQGSSVADLEHALPDHPFPAGSYIVLKGSSYTIQYPEENPIRSDFVIHVKSETDRYPWIATNGYIELLQGGETVDFVRTGSETQNPTTPGEWGAGNLNISLSSTQSYRRSALETDTNTASDWTLGAMSPTLPNESDCEKDDDADGIPDCAEQAGRGFHGVPYYDYGARPGQRDLFVEFDWVVGRRPSAGAKWIDDLKRVMAIAGITVHIDVGDAIDQDGVAGNNPANYDLCGGNELPWQPIEMCSGAGCPAGVSSVYDLKDKYMDRNRRYVFHYSMLADGQDAQGNLSYGGIANWPGNTSINNQDQAIVHELGHNLSLGHGGANAVNYKPNYYSEMNYSFPGPLVIGQNDHEIYYGHYNTPGTSTSNPCRSLYYYSNVSGYPRFEKVFSSGTAATIDENNLDETLGISNGAGLSIDWNCNGAIDVGTYALDLNGDGSLTTLEDHDDYSALTIWSASGSYSPSGWSYDPATGDGDPGKQSGDSDETGPAPENSGYTLDEEGNLVEVPVAPGSWILADPSLSDRNRPVVVD